MDTPMTGSVLLELVSIYIDLGGFHMKKTLISVVWLIVMWQTLKCSSVRLKVMKDQVFCFLLFPDLMSVKYIILLPKHWIN